MKKILGLQRGKVILDKDYNNWKIEFQKEKEHLLKLLGKNVLGIEHIGSTPILDLFAKPIIDILIGVKNIEDVKNFEQKLLENGYTFRQNGSDEGEKLFVKGGKENRTHYVHITEYNNKRYQNDIFFRDFLTRNEDYRREYENLKFKLKELYFNNREEYTKGKKEFILKILNFKQQI